MNSYFELICALMRCIRGGIFPHFSLRIEVQGAIRAFFHPEWSGYTTTIISDRFDHLGAIQTDFSKVFSEIDPS